MEIPKVSPETWTELYRAATRFQSLAPWQSIDGDIVFGVKDPDSGEVGYCCILGAAGQVFGLCMYRGAEGFSQFLEIQDQQMDPIVNDSWALQNVLMVEFVNRSELEKEDLAVAKLVGHKAPKTKHSPPCPLFRSRLPGYAPWYLSEAEAKSLTHALRCTIEFYKDFEADEDILIPDCPNGIVTYIPQLGLNGEVSWLQSWEKPALPDDTPPDDFPLNELALKKIRDLKLKKDSVWEADVFYMPGGIVRDRDRPYMTRIAIVASRESGFIFKMEMLSPEQSSTLILREVLLEGMKTHELLPSEIHVPSERLWNALKPLADELKIRLRHNPIMPMMLETKQALAERARTGFRR